MFLYTWCLKEEPFNELSILDCINHLDDIIIAIEMQIKNNKYKQEEYLRKAQLLYHKKENTAEILSEMRKRKEKEIQNTKWMTILENVHKIRNEMDNMKSMESVVNSFKKANTMMNLALKKLNNEDIEGIMADMENNNVEMQEINDLLSKNQVIDFDQDKALEEINMLNKQDTETVIKPFIIKKKVMVAN
jgi:hypothetical protein